MNWKRHGNLVGNLLLFVAFVMLFYFGALWERLGVGAFLLWMAVAAAGVFAILNAETPHDPNL
jgi:hypothetical protein